MKITAELLLEKAACGRGVEWLVRKGHLDPMDYIALCAEVRKEHKI
jgi:hypothetical protein